MTIERWMKCRWLKLDNIQEKARTKARGHLPRESGGRSTAQRQLCRASQLSIYADYFFPLINNYWYEFASVDPSDVAGKCPLHLPCQLRYLRTPNRYFRNHKDQLTLTNNADPSQSLQSYNYQFQRNFNQLPNIALGTSHTTQPCNSSPPSPPATTSLPSTPHLLTSPPSIFNSTIQLEGGTDSPSASGPVASQKFN